MQSLAPLGTFSRWLSAPKNSKTTAESSRLILPNTVLGMSRPKEGAARGPGERRPPGRAGNAGGPPQTMSAAPDSAEGSSARDALGVWGRE
eukprot:7268363-Alexandrium_andersonii.AAC.1